MDQFNILAPLRVTIVQTSLAIRSALWQPVSIASGKQAHMQGESATNTTLALSLKNL